MGHMQETYYWNGCYMDWQKIPGRMRKNDPAGIFKIYASDYSTSAPFTSTVYPSGVSQFTMRVPLKPSPSSWK